MEETPIIVITAYGGSKAAIEAMKLGAYDYITKPFDFDEVLFSIRRALTQRALVAQVQALSRDRSDVSDDGEEELVGRTPSMLQVFKTIGRVAPTREPVLIVGESGTGKELVASAIHKNSDRAGQPFVKVNSAALSPTLLESELFGHEKGAFTGAVARRVGRFEQADGGTLFLDEIGDLDIDLQAKLLRVLQTGQFERVGGDETLQVDVRVLAATNRDLPARIAEAQFREDLFYRLNVVTIELPPLRQRREDIPLLAEHILGKLARKYGWPNLALLPEAMTHLTSQTVAGQRPPIAKCIGASEHPCSREGNRTRRSSRQTLSPGRPKVVSASSESLLLRDLMAETERRAIRQGSPRSSGTARERHSCSVLAGANSLTRFASMGCTSKRQRGCEQGPFVAAADNGAACAHEGSQFLIPRTKAVGDQNYPCQWLLACQLVTGEPAALHRQIGVHDDGRGVEYTDEPADLRAAAAIYTSHPLWRKRRATPVW